MALKRIEDLDEAGALDGTELVELQSGNESLRCTTQEIADLASGGGATWGGITGTLSSQADLQAALDAKAPLESASLVGAPTAPTAPPMTSSAQIATTAYVDAAVAAGGGGGGGGGPSTFETSPISAGAIDISDEDVSVWVVELTENVTSISLPTALAGEALSLLVIFTQDATGGRTVAGWPAAIWEAGSPPTINGDAGSVTSVPLVILGNGMIYGVS